MALTTTARPVAGVEGDADVAEIGARDGAQVGHVPGIVEADERLAGSSAFRRWRADRRRWSMPGGAEIDGLEDAAVDAAAVAR